MTKAEKHYEKMTLTPVSKLIVSLGIPTTVSLLITNIYNLADTYFVGTLGESQQAATGILFTLQAIIQALAFMLGHGSGTFVSKFLADKNTKEASGYVSTAFFTGALFSALLAFAGLICIDPFMRLLGSTTTILPYAKDYGLWVLLSCPFMVCSLILNNNLRYEGKAFYAMIGRNTEHIRRLYTYTAHRYGCLRCRSFHGSFSVHKLLYTAHTVYPKCSDLHIRKIHKPQGVNIFQYRKMRFALAYTARAYIHIKRRTE